MQHDNLINIPDRDGGTFAIDGINEQQLLEAYRLLAEISQLLEEYAPAWYSTDLRDQVQSALKPSERDAPRGS